MAWSLKEFKFESTFLQPAWIYLRDPGVEKDVQTHYLLDRNPNYSTKKHIKPELWFLPIWTSVQIDFKKISIEIFPVSLFLQKLLPCFRFYKCVLHISINFFFFEIHSQYLFLYTKNQRKKLQAPKFFGECVNHYLWIV